MTREDFVKAIKTEVLDLAVRDTMMDLRDPPGRKPKAALISAHQWYRGLDPESQKFVEQVARMAAESATFGIMAILDGVRAIEAGEKGDLVLEYRKGEERLLLNDFHQNSCTTFWLAGLMSCRIRKTCRSTSITFHEAT